MQEERAEITHLSVLDLRKANIAEKGLKALSSVLQMNKASLQLLDLQENRITDSSLLLLGRSLKYNQTLCRLHLLNSLQAVSAETINTFGVYLQENECLRNASCLSTTVRCYKTDWNS